MKRKRPRRHIRKCKSGKKVVINPRIRKKNYGVWPFKKNKKDDVYLNLDDPSINERYKYNNPKITYGGVNNIPGDKVGNALIAADFIIPSGKLITAVGIGTKNYVDKVKLVQTDAQDKPYKVPRVELHFKRKKTRGP